MEERKEGKDQEKEGGGVAGYERKGEKKFYEEMTEGKKRAETFCPYAL